MKLWKVLKKYWVLFVIILCLTSWLGFFSSEYLYNNNNTYYEVVVDGNFSNIDASFFADAVDANGKKVGNRFSSVNFSLMFENEDATICYEDGSVKVKLLAKYFISSQGILLNENSFERFTKIVNVVFLYHDANSKIVSIDTYDYADGLIWTLAGLGLGIIICGLAVFLLRNKEIKLIKYDNEKTFAHPFSVNYWREAFNSLRKMKVFDLCLIAILFALQLLCKVIRIPSGFSNLGLGITYLIFSLICLIYGPCWGLIIGFFSDILGFVLFPNGTFFHFGYTIQAMLTGFIYAIFLYRTKVSFTRCVLARAFINILLNAFYGSWLWMMVIGESTTAALSDYIVFMALPKNVIYLIPQAILMYMFLKLVRPILRMKNLVPIDLLDDDIDQLLEEKDDKIE